MIIMKLRIRYCSAWLLTASSIAATAGEPAPQTVGLPMTGADAVAFLASAEVVGEPEAFDPVAITGPLRVTLNDGERTVRAVFKDENRLYPLFRYGDGREVERAKDSYRHEIAAFELATLLGLDIVPPCVERTIGSRTGSLCLWIEGARTEDERREAGLDPPDAERFRNDIREVRLFQQLIADLDFSNIRNIVVDDVFRVYKVDSSMAFYPDHALLAELDSARLSSRIVAALEGLDRKTMNRSLKPWLYADQRSALWARRGAILERARKLAAERGDENVFY